jgi:hypothetical protein
LSEVNALLGFCGEPKGIFLFCHLDGLFMPHIFCGEENAVPPPALTHGGSWGGGVGRGDFNGDVGHKNPVEE